MTVDNLQLTDKVIFAGKLSSGEVREAMKDCYVFVLPSLSEGFGRVLIEAMALSKPVIASNVGGIPEIVKDGENGFLCGWNAEEIGERLVQIISDDSLYSRLSANAPHAVQQFEKMKVIREYAEGYQRLVAK